MKMLTLKLNEAQPETLKINRLGDYLKKLAELYGSADTLYLDSVEKGSACLNIMVDDEHADQVKGRVLEASLGRGPKKYIKAYRKVLGLMEDDAYSGEFLVDDRNVVTLPLTGRAEAPQVLKQVMPTSVKGKVYRVGGTDDTVPVRLQSVNGESIYAEATIELSKELGALLYQYVHAHGQAEWICSELGKWRLSKLKIESYEVIEHVSAGEALRRLRAIGGWKNESPEQIHASILDYRG